MPSTFPSIALVDDASFEQHVPRGYHPERPERLHAARRAVTASGVPCAPLAARAATREELLRVHTPNYLDQLEMLRGRQGQLDPDTYLAPGSVDAAMIAAGGVCAAIDSLFEPPGTKEPDGRSLRRALALVRPPGHHARPGGAMGFCLVNNVAVAAAHARARGVDRVLVVDWDVHHGNGTQEAFFDDPHVLFLSLHQWPFYPGTGAVDEVGTGAGRGFTINVPLSAGAVDADYRAAFDRVVLPIAREFAPELVLVSAGFDAHRLDPLAGMQLGSGIYGWMAAELVAIADRFAEGRIALLLEGGYDLGALEESIGACIRSLSETRSTEEARLDQQDAGSRGRCERDIERARSEAAHYWSACR